MSGGEAPHAPDVVSTGKILMMCDGLRANDRNVFLYLRVFLVSNRFPDGSFSRLRRYTSPPFAHIYQRA